MAFYLFLRLSELIPTLALQTSSLLHMTSSRSPQADPPHHPDFRPGVLSSPRPLLPPSLKELPVHLPTPLFQCITTSYFLVHHLSLPALVHKTFHKSSLASCELHGPPTPTPGTLGTLRDPALPAFPASTWLLFSLEAALHPTSCYIRHRNSCRPLTPVHSFSPPPAHQGSRCPVTQGRASLREGRDKSALFPAARGA